MLLHEPCHAARRGRAFVFTVAFVGQFDVHAVIQEGKFADAFGEESKLYSTLPKVSALAKEAYGRAFCPESPTTLQRLFGFRRVRSGRSVLYRRGRWSVLPSRTVR